MTVESSRRLAPQRIVRAAQAFIHLETSGGIVLVVAAIIAMVWANTGLRDSYADLFNTHLVVDLSIIEIDESLRHWINDGLMAIFFFLMGLEIKREIVHGELSTPRRAVLPAAAALGGMIVPALIYVAFNTGTEAGDGWGIPMATDIAFALGVLSLLGSRVPFSVKVFLLGLAIADDIGAIVVIAVFYTESVNLEALAVAAGILAMILLLNRRGVRSIELYLAFAVCLWAATLESGIHATIAGVVLGLLTPASPIYDPKEFAVSARSLVDDYARVPDSGAQQAILTQIEDLSRGSEAPLERLERALHPWVSYLIVPLFALANAGVSVSGDVAEEAVSSQVTLGIFLGLLVGKPAGILLFTWIALRLKLGEMPRDAGWAQIAGVGLLGGIGFTVSLLVTDLALGESLLGTEARLGVLAASVVAATLGYLFLLVSSRRLAA